ncbi:MAG TPA: ABC transporter ATP-binding protein [Dermatophilaceae bacterium]|nr:ABC transporter ATP-binding protein [Dermatophilaceae bacterium]
MSGDTLVMSGTVERGSFQLEAELRVAPGEILGVLGPNGAGKTTLLRALSGLDALSSGTIALGDLTLDDAATDTFVPAENRPVALVFQNYRLFPHLDVRDNIAYSPRVRGAGRRQARAAADTWLERLDLVALSSRRPHQISGGQAQKVALARALAAEPRLLLLDEPLSALDARTRLEVRAQLRSHLEEFAGPVLVITHDPLEAMVMADRLLVIENGRVVQQGTPAQVARQPATQYVARLVGLNLYAGTLDPATGHVHLDDGGMFTVTLNNDFADADAAASAVAGLGGLGGLGGLSTKRVLVGLRPSAITIHTATPTHASPRNVWKGTVTALELLTDRVRVQVDASPPALVDISAAAVADLALRPGAGVWLSAKAIETEAYPEPGIHHAP